jgi:N-acyl homoserine lactone hydrolase
VIARLLSRCCEAAVTHAVKEIKCETDHEPQRQTLPLSTGRPNIRKTEDTTPVRGYVSPQKLNNYTVDRPLLPQLAAIGYTPADITYLALSHYHGDHVANASQFAKSTWIVQKGDRDAILGPRPAGTRVPDPKFFEGLADAKAIVLNGEDRDVFGDGTVVIKSSPGHTPGHQSLFLKLANTGNVLLSGDLYHYPEEITYKKVPNFDTDGAQTAKSREKIEDFVKQNHAQLWIQHDYTSGIKRKIAPAFYD